jgi:hypothetical protein
MDEPTTVRIEGDLSITLSHHERIRLLIRVMCELIAYGEDEPERENTAVDVTLTAR